nr:immunoglobulin light chain junction region [Macaca mulatta]
DYYCCSYADISTFIF